MPLFSERSQTQLVTLDPKLQAILNAAIKRYDFTVLQGFRSTEEQNKAFEEGRSKLKWPYSKHNSIPSKAVDLAPYPIDWTNIERFKDMACIVLEEAARLRIPLIWGGNWVSFKDYPHFELTYHE